MKATGVVNEVFPRQTERGIRLITSCVVGPTVVLTKASFLKYVSIFNSQVGEEGAVVEVNACVYMHKHTPLINGY